MLSEPVTSLVILEAYSMSISLNFKPTSLEGLATKTAQLPMVELDAPKTVIGKNTKHCMQSGIIFGFAGLVDSILYRIKKELKIADIKVIATGGLGEIIAKEVKAISKVDRTLTLDGLKIIYEQNKERS